MPAHLNPFTANSGLSAMQSSTSTSQCTLSSFTAAMHKFLAVALLTRCWKCLAAASSLHHCTSIQIFHLRKYLAGLFTSMSVGCSKSVVFTGRRHIVMLCTSRNSFIVAVICPLKFSMMTRAAWFGSPIGDPCREQWSLWCAGPLSPLWTNVLGSASRAHLWGIENEGGNVESCP